jgi:hypothetical protein
VPRDIVLTDPCYEPRPLGRFDRIALRVIKDERDLPFARLIAWMTITLLPGALVLYTPGVLSPWDALSPAFAIAYWAVLFLAFVDRYILMLHNTSHRPCFHRGFRWVNRWLVWGLGPFCGETPETYFAHHMGMHHAEGNLPGDLSSTMRFRRDSMVDFLRYFLRFFFGGMIELGLYHARRGHWLMLRRMLIGEWSYLVAVVLLATYVNLEATLVVFVTPLLLTRFLMMAGNWSQHAFIDPAAPENDYKSSIVCINTRYNQRCFNDGYHIGHHVKPNRHWTEMPGDFFANRERYAAEGAVVFEGIDYFQVWVLLMLKRYDVLARRFVDLGEQPRAHAEIVAYLRARTRPIVTRPA